MNQQTSEYEYRVEAQPDFSFLTVRLQPEQVLKVEASAMATMDTNLRMKTKMRGGLGRLITGESMFINEFTAQNGQRDRHRARCAGDLDHVYLENDTIFLQNTACVASVPPSTSRRSGRGFVKGFFSGESLFLIKCSGQGDLWFNTFGGMIAIDVNGSYHRGHRPCRRVHVGAGLSCRAHRWLQVAVLLPAKVWSAISAARAAVDSNAEDRRVQQLGLSYRPQKKRD